MVGQSVDEAVTLNDVANAGLSKALGKKASSGAVVPGVPTSRNHAPVCGVSAALPPEDEDEADNPDDEQYTTAPDHAGVATVDVGDWIAEDTLDNNNDEFFWEEDEEDAEVDVVRVQNSCAV